MCQSTCTYDEEPRLMLAGGSTVHTTSMKPAWDARPTRLTHQTLNQNQHTNHINLKAALSFPLCKPTHRSCKLQLTHPRMPCCTTLSQTKTYINSQAQRVQSPNRDRPRSAAALLVLLDRKLITARLESITYRPRVAIEHYCAIENFCEFDSALLITAEMCIATTGMLIYNAHRSRYYLSLLEAFF